MTTDAQGFRWQGQQNRQATREHRQRDGEVCPGYTSQRSSTPVLQRVPIYVLALTRDLYCKLSDVFALETRNIQFIL
jgi:hypothetical protein